MGMTARGPVRSAGWAFPLCSSRNDGVLQGPHRGRSVGFVILVCLFLSAVPLWAQHYEHVQILVHEQSLSFQATTIMGLRVTMWGGKGP